MAIVQEIKFNSLNNYFAGFIQNIINQSEINGSVSFKKNKIKLILDDKDTKALERFSQLSAKYLPYSIFLSKITTNKQEMKIEKNKFESDFYNIAPCPYCLEMISNPSSSRYLDDNLLCEHYSHDNTFEDDDNTFFTPHYTSGCVVLLADSTKIDDLFIMTKKEKEALFSIEKPTIKVTIKDEELKSITGKLYINIKAPYNIRSTLSALNAKDSEIPYIFFQDTNDLKVVTVQDNTTIIRASRVACKLEVLHKEKVLNRFLNICNEANFKKEAIGASISQSNGISFLVKTETASKKVILFQEFRISEILEKMSKDEKRKKLLTNFSKKYPDLLANLSQNLEYNLFDCLCIILELNGGECNEGRAFELLSNKSLEFRGNGGLKIDTQFDKKEFDYCAFIGSIMSFKLGNTDNHYIAYSIFEAIGDLTIDTLNQLKKKFNIENIVVMGDMFENTVLYSRILSKYQLSKPYFSKSFALDD